MKKLIRLFFLFGMVMLLALSPQMSNAQPPEDPGCPPECNGAGSPGSCPPQCVPIDSGLVLLIFAGIGIAAVKIVAEQKKVKQVLN